MEYNPMFYTEVIMHLEDKWKRKLTDHEKHVLIEGYKFGRQVESENEIKILDAFKEDFEGRKIIKVPRG